jgi:SAM-dependent methyltransferase
LFEPRFAAAQAMNRFAPYDRIAAQWSRARHSTSFRERTYVDRFLELAASGAHILDLGCGMGEPIGRYLLTQRCRVTGVDASPEMLRLARANCPDALFIQGRIESLDLPTQYDGIVAWDSHKQWGQVLRCNILLCLLHLFKPSAQRIESLGVEAV